MTPTTLELNLRAGAYRLERDRLLALVFAIEEGLQDGTAPVAWKALLSAARWMRDADDEGRS